MTMAMTTAIMLAVEMVSIQAELRIRSATRASVSSLAWIILSPWAATRWSSRARVSVAALWNSSTLAPMVT